jgi:hypothetical protein
MAAIGNDDIADDDIVNDAFDQYRWTVVLERLGTPSD